VRDTVTLFPFQLRFSGAEKHPLEGSDEWRRFPNLPYRLAAPLARSSSARITTTQKQCIAKAISHRSERPPFSIRPVMGSPAAALFAHDLYTVFETNGWPVVHVLVDAEYGLSERGLRIAVSCSTDIKSLNPSAIAAKAIIDQCLDVKAVPGPHNGLPDGFAALIVGHGAQ
jgi:hypothetical protein